MKTRSIFPLRDEARARNASRKTRFIRFRSTAVPSRLETENPTRGPASSGSEDPASERSKEYRTRYLLATERPVRYTRAKSSERESRPPDRFTLGYADRRLRPLSRRRLSTALPARVAMRARNPCTFLR